MNFRFSPSRLTPVSRTHISPFIFSDLGFDVAAVRVEAKARYALQLDFINRYEGEARRWWQWRLAREAVRRTWSEARSHRHNAVMDRLPYSIPKTDAETARCDQLRVVMDRSSITAQGNANFRAAAAELDTIQRNAMLRAYDAVIEQVRGEV